MDTAAPRDELTVAGTALGTVSYMSPEQARGQLADARTDLFSLGIGVWSLAGLASLVAGGLFLYDGSGGVRVSPVVLIAVAAGVALFFGVAVSRLLAIRRVPPVPHGAEAIIGKDGVVIGAGLGPNGVVRVASEEWRAVSTSGPIPVGSRVRVTGLDGLVLTVESLADEHRPAVAPAEGGTTR